MNHVTFENLEGPQRLRHIDKSAIIKRLLSNNRETLLNGDECNAICYDGIVDDATYSKQKFHLAFLLKETNGNTSDGKKPDRYDEWDYASWIRDTQSTGAEPLYPSFRNISMWASEFYDIFENGSIDKSKYLENGVLKITDELKESLRKIAIVNLKKTFGGGATDWKNLNSYLTQDVCDIVREELFTIEPTVVLCGGQQVFDLVSKLHRTEKGKPLTTITQNGLTVEYIPACSYIYVNFKHPACRKSREFMFEYAADVFKALREIIK